MLTWVGGLIWRGVLRRSMSMTRQDLYDTTRAVTIDGTHYRQTACVLRNADMRIEDHGILALNLTFQGEGENWVQGIGYIGLDVPGPDSGRVGTAAGMTLIRRVLDVFGATSLDDLSGRTCFIYRYDDRTSIEGFHPRDCRTPPFFWRSVFNDSEES